MIQMLNVIAWSLQIQRMSQCLKRYNFLKLVIHSSIPWRHCNWWVITLPILSVSTPMWNNSVQCRLTGKQEPSEASTYETSLLLAFPWYVWVCMDFHACLNNQPTQWQHILHDFYVHWKLSALKQLATTSPPPPHQILSLWCFPPGMVGEVCTSALVIVSFPRILSPYSLDLWGVSEEPIYSTVHAAHWKSSAVDWTYVVYLSP